MKPKGGFWALAWFERYPQDTQAAGLVSCRVTDQKQQMNA